jgi:peptidoglycan/LPS O-acetylase OafA/YrhL
LSAADAFGEAPVNEDSAPSEISSSGGPLDPALVFGSASADAPPGNPLHRKFVEAFDELEKGRGGEAEDVSLAAAEPYFIPLKYRPEIDGLRAVAVLPVLLYHFKASFPGGYAGVDVFFAISGYLITNILLAKMEKRKFSMRNFFVRRSRRLFPALAVVLAMTLAVGWHVFLADTFTSTARQVQAVLLVGGNFHFYRLIGYMTESSLEQPLLHCWSLVVEEQFYLVFPILLQLLWCGVNFGWYGPRAVLLALCIVAAGSLGHATATAPSMFGFYLLPARAWEMVIGGILVFDRSESSIFHTSRAAAEVCSWGGMALIWVSYFVLDHHTPYPSYRALLPCLGTALFLGSQRTHLSSCGRLLASPPFVFIGKFSYSLYLWHYDGRLPPEQTVLGIFLSFLAAVVSYLVVEQATRLGRSKSKKTGARHQNQGDVPKDSTGLKAGEEEEEEDNAAVRAAKSTSIKKEEQKQKGGSGTLWGSGSCQVRSCSFELTDRRFLSCTFVVWLSIFLFAYMADRRDIGGIRFVAATATENTNVAVSASADDLAELGMNVTADEWENIVAQFTEAPTSAPISAPPSAFKCTLAASMTLWGLADACCDWCGEGCASAFTDNHRTGSKITVADTCGVTAAQVSISIMRRHCCAG